MSRTAPGLAAALMSLSLGACPEGASSRPSTSCTKAYDKCVLASGVLGICNPVECKADEPAPCLVCRSQH